MEYSEGQIDVLDRARARARLEDGVQWVRGLEGRVQWARGRAL